MHFGNAVDIAVELYLKKQNLSYIEVFDKEWHQATDMYGRATVVFDNHNINYSHADFDPDVLQEADLELMNSWAQELGLIKDGLDPVELFKTVQKIKKSKFKKIKDDELKYFNRCSWLSLRRKGHLMLHSFVDQFVPRIEEVIHVQKHSEIVSTDNEDSISGKIDAILKIKNYDKPIIFDLKTSSRPYKEQNLLESEQLTLYAAMEGGKINTDYVGYVVLSKAINKEKVAHCVVCGRQKDGRHKTCNSETPTGRCGGEWKESLQLKPTVQVLIGKKNQKQIEQQLAIETQTIDAMKAGVVYKNTSKCNNWYGNRCPYYGLCYDGDTTGLTKKG